MNDFFKTHANPFLLNINQVYNLLKENGYGLNTRFDKFNIIEIAEDKKDLLDIETKADNVIILLSLFNTAFAQELVSNSGSVANFLSSLKM